MTVFNYTRRDGLGFPAPTDHHRMIQTWLSHNIDKKLRRNYIVGMEYAVRKGKKECIPDVSVWEAIVKDKKGEVHFQNPLLTIEITHTADNDATARESIYDVFSMSNSVAESFIYNYETETWTRFKRDASGKIEEKQTDYSALFGIYLGKLL